MAKLTSKGNVQSKMTMERENSLLRENSTLKEQIAKLTLENNLLHERLQEQEKSASSKNTLQTHPEEIVPLAKDKGVRKQKLQEVTGTAKILHDLFYFNLSCSECGFKGFAQNATECPNCKRKFVK